MYQIFFSLICGLIFMLAPTVSLAGFEDVEKNHPNFEAINYVQSAGIVKGYADGTYRADQNINRAEFTKIIVEAVVGQEPLEHAGSCFPDVSSAEWFYSYICYAKRMGILGGYPDGFFKPANFINFVEAAKIINIAYKYEVDTDAEIWYKGFVSDLGNRQAIPISILSFDQVITRGEMAEIIYRLKAEINNKPSQSYDSLVGTVDAEEVGICSDMCGDGPCQEIVCLGTGCPCAETAANCPEDCSENEK